KVDRTFRVLQLFSAALYSLGHGTNDAQKTMGIIVGLLFAARASFVDFPVRALHVTTPDVIPLWVIFGAYAAIALGTLPRGWGGAAWRSCRPGCAMLPLSASRGRSSSRRGRTSRSGRASRSRAGPCSRGCGGPSR